MDYCAFEDGTIEIQHLNWHVALKNNQQIFYLIQILVFPIDYKANMRHVMLNKQANDIYSF